MASSVREMTPEDLAGQRLMAGFDGTRATGWIVEAIGRYRLGGVILFARNLESPSQVRGLLRGLQQAAKDAGLPPLLVAVDQEGGTVERLPSPPYTHFAGNPSIATEAEADAFCRVCAQELREAGFNMNLAPVVDVVPASGTSIMEKRAFPGGPEQVARLGAAVVEGLQKRGILACAKHFPGIGATVLDSHVELPVCDLTGHELASRDLVPFTAAVRAGVAAVMLSHILYPRLDREWPASMSETIARDMLRGNMGFRGLVLTDDLDMGAVANHFTIPTAMERVLLADIDMALICHPSDSLGTAHATLSRALRDNPGLLDNARHAAARILEAKAGLA